MQTALSSGTLNISKGSPTTLVVRGPGFTESAVLYVNFKLGASYAGPYRHKTRTVLGSDWTENVEAVFTFEISGSETAEIGRSMEFYPGNCGSVSNAGTYVVHGRQNSVSAAINILQRGTISVSGLRGCDGGESPSDSQPGDAGGDSGANQLPAPYNSPIVESGEATDAFGPRDISGQFGSRTFTPGAGGPPGFGGA